MVYKEVKNGELYVWMNGSLLYKRWINRGYGMVMCRTAFTAKDVEQFKLSFNDTKTNTRR